VREQDRLHLVLRGAGGRRGAEHRALLAARVADLDRGAARGVGHRLGEEHPHEDLIAALAHLRLDPPQAHQLHRAQAEHGGAGMRRAGEPALDEQDGDLAAGELDGGRQPGGAGADDQDGGLGGHEGMVRAAAPRRMSSGYSFS